ncbi:MAG: succinate dehydrogenase assembly factor 2 [Proteobacteria bacterium]|nr:succinate dehydrogenase assembly factor 2 [Pseudomonadota bacterium]
MTAPDTTLKAVLYRAKYRSSKEADTVLGGFALVHARSLSSAELSSFAALLVHDDPEIFAWMETPDNAPSEISRDLLARLKQFMLAPRA